MYNTQFLPLGHTPNLPQPLGSLLRELSAKLTEGVYRPKGSPAAKSPQKVSIMKSNKRIRSSWSWIGLGGIFLPAVSIYGLCTVLPTAEGSDFYVWLGILIGGFLIGMWVTIKIFFRFVIDENGVRMQRLLFSRFFPWNEVKEIIISSTPTKGRFLETAVICTEKRRPYIDLKAGDVFRRPKWCMCIDLNSKDYPAEHGIPFVEKESFFLFIQEHVKQNYEIEINYDHEALKQLKRRERRGNKSRK